MGEDPDVYNVVQQLDQACREAGFFYVVIYNFSFWLILFFEVTEMEFLVFDYVTMILLCTRKVMVFLSL